MLDPHTGLALVRTVLDTRQGELEREQRRHRLAGEARTARAARTAHTADPAPRRGRRVLARLIPAHR